MKKVDYFKVFSLYIKMSEKKTYYQGNRDFILSTAKDYSKK